jgi:hypothetical protein
MVAMAPPDPSQTPPPPADPGPPPQPGPDASRAEWHAWRHQQRDYMRAHGGWYGPPWGWYGGSSWFWGGALVLFGLYLLLQNLGLLENVRGDVVWPVLLILLGVVLIVARGRWWR